MLEARERGRAAGPRRPRRAPDAGAGPPVLREAPYLSATKISQPSRVFGFSWRSKLERHGKGLACGSEWLLLDFGRVQHIQETSVHFR